MSESWPLLTPPTDSQRRAALVPKPPPAPPRFGWLWVGLSVAAGAAVVWAMLWAHAAGKHWKPGHAAWIYTTICGGSIFGLVSVSLIFERGSLLQRLLSGAVACALTPIAVISGCGALLLLLNAIFSGHGWTPFM